MTPAPLAITQSTLERFWSRVDKSGPLPLHDPKIGPCWIWTGATTSPIEPYGRLRVGGKEYGAHRLAWLIEHGQWPRAHALHHCDNPRCVRPSHLFDGDDRANIEDMHAKGRGVTGSRHPDSKLTEDDVRKIVSLHRVDCVGQAEIAKAYGVSHSTIYDIFRGTTWRRVTGIIPQESALRRNGPTESYRDCMRCGARLTGKDHVLDNILRIHGRRCERATEQEREAFRRTHRWRISEHAKRTDGRS